MNSGTLTRIGFALALLFVAATALADSYISNNHKHAWAENAGWSNWADAAARTQGVTVYQVQATQFITGWIWLENVGWAHVGNAMAPYANTNGTNYGININPSTGDMTGFAWAENAGWINFGPFTSGSLAPQARWDHTNFRSRGWAWCESLGWINLDDAIRFVCAIPGDLDYDGDVDVFDFNIFAPNFGAFGNPPYTFGDLDGDGDTDVFDFNIFAPNFGKRC